MRPVRLRLKGFTSFKDGTDVSFETLDRFAICGPTGAGKSSLLDALTFALFADAPRKGTGTLGAMISLGRKSFSVVLDFRVGETTFRVTRVRRRAGAGSDQLERVVGPERTEQLANGEEPVTAHIERLLGLSYAHFTQAVFLPQGKFAEFLKAKPAVRRELLNDLLRLGVYERMQERAGRDRDDYRTRLDQAERRLREDFEGVTAEALAELERQREQIVGVVAAADAELSDLQARRETARQARAWTVEWEGKVTDRARHLAGRPEIDAARAEWECAQRAAGVVPIVDQAEGARRDDRQRQDALAQAARARDVCRDEHAAAALALTRATETAAGLPDLRDRLTRLNVAVGRLALRDQLARQVAQNRERIRELGVQRVAAADAVERSAQEIGDLTALESGVVTEIASIAFDEDRWRRLEAALPTAEQLRFHRRQLASARGQVDVAGAAMRAAEAEADRAASASALAARDSADARARWDAAAAALRAGESAHAAAHLRAHLLPGQDCPVCRRGIEVLPTDDAVPELDALGRQEAEARHASADADSRAAQTASAAAGVAATAEAARQRLQSAGEQVAVCQQAVSEHENRIRESVGDLVPEDPSAPVEDRVLAAVRQSRDRHERDRHERDRLAGLRHQLTLARQSLDSHRQHVARWEEQTTAVAQTLAADEEGLRGVRDEILAAAGTDEPGPEAQRVDCEITRLEGLLTEATANERDAFGRLQTADTIAGTRGQEADASAARAAAAEARAADGLREAGFDDPAAARAAYREPHQVRTLQDRFTSYDATTRALDHRIAELEALLGGARIAADECARAEAAHEECLRRRSDADRQAALLGQQVEDVRVRLDRAQRLRDELAEVDGRFRVYDWLARDLRSDRFQAYLLDETLTALVADGSCHLARLTGDRYGLAFEGERIFVVDHDNAGERRGVDTLSGGETFLASLALALALSSQIQHIAGAVHLDCLFIDEGFGTLDPESLRTVSDAIRGLQVGGRMVGIITHVPELKEEFDQRLIVAKDGVTSQVRLEVA
jgi:exonuclease SbcC